jgi:SAM-dependent methyltransferase
LDTVADKVRSFLEFNRSISQRVARVLPHARWSIGDLYDQTVAAHLGHGALAVDVGGGKRCSFARLRPPGDDVRIVAVDISAEALSGNVDVDETRAADVVRDGLPFADGEVDVVTSRSVLEHLADVERFVEESERVLKPGGYAIHLIPGRRGLFALLNRLLPNRVSKSILFSLRPACVGIGGFPAIYDRCSYGEMKAVFERHGHEVVELRPSYFGAQYFEFFFPLFLLVSAYEAVCSALHAEGLASRLLIVARKRHSTDPEAPLRKEALMEPVA